MAFFKAGKRQRASGVLKKSSLELGLTISLCDLCGSLCLCGENANKNTHHRDTEIAQRTTERIC
jgi:hypothetical protein